MLSVAFMCSLPSVSSRPQSILSCSHSRNSSFVQSTFHPPSPAQNGRVVLRVASAALKEDFLTGPSFPPRPRPLYQVMIFTITTNFLWYGYYKYCIEEELRRLTGEGLGGVATLLPFIIGVTSPFYLPRGGPAECGFAAGLLWIVAIQYSLYKRINALMIKKGQQPPLTPWWIVVPGFNLIVGLRSIHFLSLVFGADKDVDPVVAFFPFLGKDSLGIWEFVVTPSLWLRLGKRQ